MLLIFKFPDFRNCGIAQNIKWHLIINRGKEQIQQGILPAVNSSWKSFNLINIRVNLSDKCLQRDVAHNETKPQHSSRLKQNSLCFSCLPQEKITHWQLCLWNQHHRLLITIKQWRRGSQGGRCIYSAGTAGWIRVDAYRCRSSAEWWGHTQGFKAAGSLSIRTTVAVWNAHHAQGMRAKTVWKTYARLRPSHCNPNAMLTREKARDKTEEERKCGIWKYNTGFLLFGSIDHRKQTNSLHVKCVTGQLPILQSSETFYFACLSRRCLITVAGEYWKEAGRIESESGALLRLCTLRLWLSGEAVLQCGSNVL